MGTRNLTIVISNNEIKVAQYGQWDGFPDGQGKRILTFLRRAHLQRFKQQLEKVRFMNDKDEQEIEEYFNKIGAVDGLCNRQQGVLFNKRYPTLSRDTGAWILSRIYRNNAKELLLQNAYEFAGDGLFCEWCYVIDLDQNYLEVYTGFNEQPLTEDDRFFPLQEQEQEYYPVKLIKQYSLDELPTIEMFLQDLQQNIEPLE